MPNHGLQAPQLVDTSGPGITRTSRQSSNAPQSVEMDEVILNGDELQVMVKTLRSRAQDVVVHVKRAADSANQEAITLDELAPVLLRGETFGAQIQYSYESGRWLDTLVVTRDGIRLVRVQMG